MAQTKRKIKVLHYRDRCIGCGACVARDPKNWFTDFDGKATLKDSRLKGNCYQGEIDQQDYEANKKAEMECPTAVIKIED